MGKITEIVDLKVTQSGDAGSVKSLREEIRMAKEEALQMARAFGDFSPEATAAAQKVAMLSDEMGDFQQRVNALSPDKFQTIARVASGLAGGFAAAQGAMALLGVESEDLQKTMVKLQAVMALSQGIQGLTDLKQSFGSMVSYIKTVVIPAFNTAAGAANMIGKALGIGIIITGIVSLIGWVKELGKEAERTADMMAGIRESTIKGMEALKISVANTETFLKEAGKSAEVILAEQIRLIDEFINEVAQKQLTFDDPELQKQIEAAMDMKARLIYKHNQDIERAELDSQQKRLAAEKAYYDKSIQEQKDWQEKVRREQEKNNANVEKIEEAFDTADINAERNKRAEQDKIADDFIKNEEARRRGEAARKKYYTDKEIAEIKAVQEAKQFAYDSTSQLLGAAAEAFEQGSAAQKAFAIAQIAFDEARAIASVIAGATAAAAAGGPAAPFLVAGYIASGLATVAASFKRVKDILGTAQQSAGVSQGSAPTLSQPIISGQLPGSDQTGAVMQFGKVYVLEGDITKTQGRVRTNKNVAVV